MAIAAGAAWGLRARADGLAARHVRVATTDTLPLKYQTLALQRAALASGHVLPIYGSSELTCCGDPYRATELFASEPTGFGVLALGRAGTADLFFSQTFAALGTALAGRPIVLSDSPSWFWSRNGVTPVEWSANFLPETAYALVFEAPLGPHLRKAGAARLLAHREWLRDEPLLRLAALDLARPAPLARAEYAALAPLGRLAASALEVRDALRTVAVVELARWRGGDPPRRPRAVDWPRLAATATRIAKRRDTTNPFGFPDDVYVQLRRRASFQRALALYRAGQSNRDGHVLPPPDTREAAMERSEEWLDLRLALGVLRELGARPLVWTLPMPGRYDDYTQVSAPARQAYYDRYERVARRAGVAWLDFRPLEDDPYFVADPGSHLGPRGWLFADRALDVFWHGGSTDDIRSALVTLTERVPARPAGERRDAG
jgi:poly-D-alanine transfer protein DltD